MALVLAHLAGGQAAVSAGLAGANLAIPAERSMGSSSAISRTWASGIMVAVSACATGLGLAVTAARAALLGPTRGRLIAGGAAARLVAVAPLRGQLAVSAFTPPS